MAQKHTQRAHALLAPSAASRWLVCTPSARLEDAVPTQPPTSYAEEGTLAHEIAEIELKMNLKLIDFNSYREAMSAKAKSEYFDASMLDYIDIYVNFIKEQLSNLSDPTILIEEKVDITAFVPEGFGSNDCIIIADEVMYVDDLKYGKGVKVSAQENKQLMLYSLGSLIKYSIMYDIKKVVMSIIQPRLNWIDSFEMSVDDLLKWGYDEVKPKADLAFKGEGTLQAGSHCRWCRVAAKCRALAQHNQQVAKHEFKNPALLSDEELVDLLHQSETIVNWAKTVQEYVFQKALEGKKFKGYKLVEGRSSRKIVDEEQVVTELFTLFRFNEDQYMNKKLKGITDLEKLLGKKEFEKVLGKYVVKPPGKPALVPEDDPRAEYFASAKDEFKD